MLLLRIIIAVGFVRSLLAMLDKFKIVVRVACKNGLCLDVPICNIFNVGDGIIV